MFTLYNIIHGPEVYLAVSVWAFGVASGITFVGLVSGFEREKEDNISNLKLIEALCEVVEQLVVVVKRLADKLEQVNALDDAERQAVANSLEQYRAVLGTDEIPDEYMEESHHEGC